MRRALASDHEAAVARRLELLSAELATVRGDPPVTRPHLRVAGCRRRDHRRRRIRRRIRPRIRPGRRPRRRPLETRRRYPGPRSRPRRARPVARSGAAAAAGAPCLAPVGVVGRAGAGAAPGSLGAGAGPGGRARGGGCPGPGAHLLVAGAQRWPRRGRPGGAAGRRLRPGHSGRGGRAVSGWLARRLDGRLGAARYGGVRGRVADRGRRDRPGASSRHRRPPFRVPRGRRPAGGRWRPAEHETGCAQPRQGADRRRADRGGRPGAGRRCR